MRIKGWLAASGLPFRRCARPPSSVGSYLHITALTGRQPFYSEIEEQRFWGKRRYRGGSVVYVLNGFLKSGVEFDVKFRSVMRRRWNFVVHKEQIVTEITCPPCRETTAVKAFEGRYVTTLARRDFPWIGRRRTRANGHGPHLTKKGRTGNVGKVD